MCNRGQNNNNNNNKRSTLRKETKNSYLQLQGTETWSTIYNNAERISSNIIIIIVI